MNCLQFYLHYTGTWKICLKFMFVLLIMLIDYPQSLTNADTLGQGNLDLVREKSVKCQGILLSIICGNPDLLRSICPNCLTFLWYICIHVTERIFQKC